MSYIKDHSEDFKEALSAVKPKKNTDDSSIQSQSETHEKINTLPLLIIWSQQVTFPTNFTYLRFQNNLSVERLIGVQLVAFNFSLKLPSGINIKVYST